MENVVLHGSYKMPDILANQWCSLWEDHTLYEKMVRDGEIQGTCSGGSIVHINVDSKITRTQAKNLINEAIENGMAHYALNSVYVECEDCGYVHKGKVDECPKCHSKNLKHFTRIIGYFSQIEKWSKDRREKDFPRRKFMNYKDIEDQLGQ